MSPSNNNLGEWYTGYQGILCADCVVGFSRTGSYEWAKCPNPVYHTRGYWKDGKLHGRGRRVEYYGDYYIGEWKEGWKNGEGTYYYNNGDRYEGGWRDSKKYGQATMYINGDKYIAQ